MAKDEPELMITAVHDHGDGTGTVYAWADLDPAMLEDMRAGMGDPLLSSITQIEYREDGSPIVAVHMTEEHDSVGPEDGDASES